MQQTYLCSLFTVCKLHSCRLKLYNCYSAYTIHRSSCLALLNDLGDTGIAETNSQKCCQLFEIQSTRTPEKEPWICVFYVVCMFYGYIWLQKWLLHWDKHSSRERVGCVCRSSFNYFISLYVQNEACRTATPPLRGACRLFCNGQTNTEWGPFWNSEKVPVNLMW